MYCYVYTLLMGISVHSSQYIFLIVLTVDRALKAFDAKIVDNWWPRHSLLCIRPPLMSVIARMRVNTYKKQF